MATKKMPLKCIQNIMNESLLFVKNSLEPYKIKYINTWLQFQNVYIDKLDDIVNKYNSTYHSASKMLILNLILTILLDCQNIKIFLQKVTLQIGLKKFLWLKKLKILCPELMLLMISMEKKLLEHFTKNNCKKQIKKSLELKK